MAATGQGKSATQIVENLLTYTGSVVVVDPKGELYDLTSARRRDFGKVFRLAPYAQEGEHTDHYNPLDELADPRELGSRARHLAEMLIVRQGDKGASNATFFENEAVNLLTAILVFVVESTEPCEPALLIGDDRRQKLTPASNPSAASLRSAAPRLEAKKLTP